MNSTEEEEKRHQQNQALEAARRDQEHRDRQRSDQKCRAQRDREGWAQQQREAQLHWEAQQLMERERVEHQRRTEWEEATRSGGRGAELAALAQFSPTVAVIGALAQKTGPDKPSSGGPR